MFLGNRSVIFSVSFTHLPNVLRSRQPRSWPNLLQVPGSFTKKETVAQPGMWSKWQIAVNNEINDRINDNLHAKSPSTVWMPWFTLSTNLRGTPCTAANGFDLTLKILAFSHTMTTTTEFPQRHQQLASTKRPLQVGKIFKFDVWEVFQCWFLWENLEIL